MAKKLDPRGTVLERLVSRYEVDEATGCWNWTGAVSAGKYGSLYYNGRMQKAHRVAWALFRGDVPRGLDLDHLCRNTRCCNPNHLEPVSRSENLRRGEMDRNSFRTHCKRGHEFTEENTMWRKGGKWRACRECQRMHTKEWRAAHA